MSRFPDYWSVLKVEGEGFTEEERRADSRNKIKFEYWTKQQSKMNEGVKWRIIFVCGCIFYNEFLILGQAEKRLEREWDRWFNA